ncbi:LptA/OstA family protein [Methyloceanibacter sp.]|uniref:LptA/OstA family protein n=1 Tax=Methyloceanibacter sp. TaxID=1965321 RepID=UPI003D6D2B41
MSALAKPSLSLQAVRGALLAAGAVALSLLAAPPAAAQTMTNTFGGFSKNSNEPIDIESDVLVVHDAQKYATFKGNVKAVQGTTTLRSRELDVHYVGSGSDSLAKGPDTTGSTPAAPSTSAGDAKPSGVGLGTNNGTQISKIEARGEVVITSDQDQTTTSDWALYDVPAQLVTVGGNVVLMQGKNVLKGDRLVIDLKTGESRFENRSNTAAGGRIRALFMPKEAKPGDDSSKSDTSSGDKSAEKSADKGAGSEKAAAPAAPAAAAEPAADTPMPLLPGAPQ